MLSLPFDDGRHLDHFQHAHDFRRARCACAQAAAAPRCSGVKARRCYDVDDGSLHAVKAKCR